MIWSMMLVMLSGATISLIAAMVIRWVGPRLGMIDNPGHRKVHEHPMPTCGGLAIWLGIVLPLVGGLVILHLLTFGVTDASETTEPLIRLPEIVTLHASGILQQTGRLWTLLGCATLLMLLGLIDDLRGLNWKIRIGVQILIAAYMVHSGWRMTLFIDVPVVTYTLSILWFVGLINSFNMLDNMDGLSAGVAAISATILAAVMFLAPDPTTGQPQLFIAGFLLLLVGSLIGFLWHNRAPARLFMGDAGSYLIGFLIAAMTLGATFTSYDRVAPFAIMAPLCVLAVPLYDTITVIFIRLKSGKSPFEGDKNHFSHRLVELGMTKPNAVLTIYLTSATCGLGALLLHQVNSAGACIIFLLITCVLILIGILETTGRNRE